MSRSRLRRRSVVTALAGVVAACAAVPAVWLPAARAASTSELQSRRAQARQLATEVAALDARIDAVVQRRAQATQALTAVRAQIVRNRRMQRVAVAELRVARATLAARAVALYKNGDVTALDAMLNAADFVDLVDQMALMRDVARADREVVLTVETMRRRLADRALSLAADAHTAARLVRRRDAELRAIRARLGERQALLGGVRADVRRLAAQERPVVPAPGPSVAPPSPGGGGGGLWWSLIQQAAAVEGVSARGMYRLMMIESGGQASVVGPGGYYGLFQYAPSTWKGSWNPYRGRSITDGAAQIEATALALKLGYGHAWWDPSYSWAFGGG